MAVNRITSQDTGYITGSLSVYPEAQDSPYQLYQAVNNAQTALKQSLTYSGKYIIVENNDQFPSSGILRIGAPPGQTGAAELVYYDTKTAGVFQNLIRGFAGTRQNPWPLGSVVSQGVFAEHHNSVKDAVINLEKYVGLKTQPTSTSLNGILKAQENRFLSPKALFRAYPTKAPPGTKVRFHNFSTGPLVRFLWDFGDGTTSVEKNPLHTYQKEGVYTVKLNIISSLGAQGIATKKGYITISETAIQPFFYVTPNTGISLQTAIEQYGNPNLATTFNFVDQTDGNIVQRYWVFDGPGKHNGVQVDSQSIAEFDPNIHYTSYVYDLPGIYQPSLLNLFDNQQLQRAFLRDNITVE